LVDVNVSVREICVLAVFAAETMLSETAMVEAVLVDQLLT
jgi:hypothetical protein